MQALPLHDHFKDRREDHDPGIGCPEVYGGEKGMDKILKDKVLVGMLILYFMAWLILAAGVVTYGF